MALSGEDRRLEELLQKERPGLLSGMPDEQKKQLFDFLRARLMAAPVESGTAEQMSVAQSLSMSRSYSGPVPPAELLEGYAKAFPDGANRLFSLVESQSAHRQAIEARVIESQARLATRGQWMAFIVAILFGAFSVVLAMYGHEVVAGVLGGSTVLGLAGSFILGQRSQDKSLDRKMPLSDKPVPRQAS